MTGITDKSPKTSSKTSLSASLRRAFHRLRSFFRKDPLDHELNDEMASHIELAMEEYMRKGMPEEEARRQAMVRFGGVQQAREQHRETRGLPWIDVLGQDLRFTFRTLARDRSLTIIAILILGLGIGANVTVFSVVDTILLRPLPFRDPQQLVWITGNKGVGGLSGMTYSVDAYEDYRAQNRSLQDVTAYFPFYGQGDYKLTGYGEPQPVNGVMVAGNFFELLGIQPKLGRSFVQDELIKGGRPAVLLSEPFWKRQFNGDPKIVGQTINLNKTPTIVAGVIPATFDFGSVFAPGTRMDIFVPAVMDDMREWGNVFSLIGRMKPGVSVGQVQAEADMLIPQFYARKTHPEYGKGYTGTVWGLKEYVSGKLHRSLVVLWSAVGLIMLIVCVNLSNLLLARSAARSKEFAMRSVLGARRSRLVRQLLTESLVLAAGGAVLGLGIAYAVVTWLAHQGSIALPLLSSIRVDGSALAWTLGIAVVAAVLFGLAPGLKMSSGDLQESLKDSGMGASSGRKHDRMRSILVVSEVALACILMVGAGLLLRSFLHVLDIDLGFRPSRAASMQVTYDDGNKDENRGPILENMLDHVKAIPGIEAAGITDMLPLDRNRSWNLFRKGRDPNQKPDTGTYVQVVTPGYIGALGMRLIKGRDFTWDDSTHAEHAVIINESLARREWPGQDPVGRLAVANGEDSRVIGVVADVKETGLEIDPGAEMYVPVTQNGPVGAELVVRTSLPPEALAASVMKVLKQMNPGQPATEFRSIQQLVDHSVSPRKFFVLLVSTFAGLGLLLASLGIYGVISYSVARQTQEIGIRMALGASRTRVQAAVIGKTLRLALIGIVLGGAASFVMARGIASLLYGTEPADPLTFVGMVVLLGIVAMFAGYLPARRASRIDPMIALRTN
ncbi:ABC transporter permease [Alloacidobacterium dinghuense]|uniref:ABC transporter permease n=1 Tax=Alloacidobacterium dinghuense TaxID=2763107 RepID=A0A7G8BCD7_9BACT|nr:ABC transporter permease [Alloacidobacterium dinghuense]QNI30207.1 ABC transporter permease [Alloacidobacterium dinghuense]